MRDNSILVKGAEKIGIVLSEKQQQQFEAYYDYLVAQNEVMNLTAITEYEEVLCKHFLDSLFVAKKINDFQGKKVLDLGTGAGFPGIPLKIAFPETEFVLMGSLNKRISFLNRVIELLDLKNITAVHGRAVLTFGFYFLTAFIQHLSARFINAAFRIADTVLVMPHKLHTRVQSAVGSNR